MDCPGAEISGLMRSGPPLDGLLAHEALIVQGPRDENEARVPSAVVAPTVKEKAEWIEPHLGPLFPAAKTMTVPAASNLRTAKSIPAPTTSAQLFHP